MFSISLSRIDVYRITGGHCKNCPLKPSCIADNYSNRIRFIYRNPYQDGIDEVKARQNRIDFKQKLIERKWKIEGIFAEAKRIMVYEEYNSKAYKKHRFKYS